MFKWSLVLFLGCLFVHAQSRAEQWGGDKTEISQFISNGNYTSIGTDSTILTGGGCLRHVEVISESAFSVTAVQASHELKTCARAGTTFIYHCQTATADGLISCRTRYGFSNAEGAYFETIFILPDANFIVEQNHYKKFDFRWSRSEDVCTVKFRK